MNNKFNDNKKEDGRQYIGNEETEYIYVAKTEYQNIEEDEYKEPSKDKRDEFNIINKRYKIVDILGKGGMGAVYKALDIRLKYTPVAIKEISLETIKNESIEKVIENFENEAEVLLSLRHNSIPRVMDFFCLDNNKCYIVMDLIEGETLEQVVKRRGEIPESEVREWLSQLTDVLSYLHNKDPKIIFRDLKPSNIMLTKDNEIKLIDFGIARTFKYDKNRDTEYYVSQGFSAPEQYGIGQSDERTDIYSLGVTLYTLLIGRRPKIKDFKFINLKDLVDISDELNTAIMKAIEFRPENRPQSIDEFIKIATYKNKVNENIYDNTKIEKKFPNIILTSIISISVLFVLIVGIYIFLDHKYLKDNENVSYNKVNTIEKIDSNKETSSEIDSNKEVDFNINKASDTLYEITGANKDNILYEINKSGSYVTDKNIANDYYIFDEIDVESEDKSDRNFLVDRKNFGVYVCYPYNLIIPYEDFINTNTVSGKYFNQYLGLNEEYIPEKTKKYILNRGIESFRNEMLRILKNSREYTVECFGGPVYYVEEVLAGRDAKELDIQAYVYPNHEFGALSVIDRMFEDYEVAVETGNPSLMYKHITSNGQSRKDYDKNIPSYYKQGITVEVVDYTINDIKIESEEQLRVSCITKFHITNLGDMRVQKEKCDFIVMLSDNKEALVDRIENWAIIK